ncbi:hypothetical protein SDC9_99335 [bioreactor metagenome]|uniref:Uncharacterized protein n=1 Tax=bioreactor metagenome TaxID=1076179 RepID=A0A645AHA8_9ZZZZ
MGGIQVGRPGPQTGPCVQQADHQRLQAVPVSVGQIHAFDLVQQGKEHIDGSGVIDFERFFYSSAVFLIFFQYFADGSGPMDSFAADDGLQAGQVFIGDGTFPFITAMRAAVYPGIRGGIRSAP